MNLPARRHTFALGTALALCAAPAADALAIDIPIETLPGDPDAGWKKDLRTFIGTFTATDFRLPQAANGRPGPFERTGNVVGTAGPYTPAEELSIEEAWLLEAGTAPYAQILNMRP